jgi:hypothetical protein
MGTVSSALIAFGFLAQVASPLDPFVAAVLPAVFVLGEFTFAALVRNTLENLALLRQMQRIRGYYRTLVPEADQFFGPAAEAERFSAAMATVGLRAWPAGMLFTGASVIAAINSVVGGVGLALLVAKVASLATGAALAVGITAAVVLFGLHLLYQQQRATNRGIISLVVEVDAGGDQHDEDGRGDPVDDQAERRPPAGVGHIVAPVLPEVLDPMAGEAGHQ